MRPRSPRGLWPLVILPLWACSDRPATGIVLALRANEQALAALDHLDLTIHRPASDAPRFSRCFTAQGPCPPPGAAGAAGLAGFAGTAGDAGFAGAAGSTGLGGATAADPSLPGTLTLYPSHLDDTSTPVLVVLEGKDAAGVTRLRRQARMPFVKEKTKLLRLGLNAACLDVDCQARTGRDDQTCINGQCTDDSVTAEGAPDFVDLPGALDPFQFTDLAGAGGAAGSAGEGGSAGQAGTGGLSGHGGMGGESDPGGQGGMGGQGGLGGSSGPGGQGGAADGTLLLAKEVALGINSACALEMGSGEAYCWGTNTSLWASNPTREIGTRAYPVAMGLKAPLSLLRLGADHACALDASLQLWCWGENFHFALGTEDPTMDQPHQVPLVGVTDLALGAQTSCALVAGDVHCWGDNSENQLGSPEATPQSPKQTATPQLIELPAKGEISAIRAEPGGTLFCAQSSQDIYCWGQGLTGPQGLGLHAPPAQFAVGNGEVLVRMLNGPSQSSRPDKGKLPALTSSEDLLTAVSSYPQSLVGGYQFCVVAATQDAVICQRSADMTTTITGFASPILSIAAGSTTAPYGPIGCALLMDGKLQCWGYDQDGVLGFGAPENHTTPVQVGQGYSDLRASYSWTTGDTVDGHAALWGQPPLYLQVASGVDYLTPTLTPTLDGGHLRAIASQYRATLIASGKLAVIGQDGQPISPPLFLARASYLDAYPDDSTDLALAADGTVWANVHGAMDPHHLAGNATPQPGEQPLFFGTKTMFTGLLKGWESSDFDLSACALGGGELWCWGDNSHHQVSPTLLPVDMDHAPPTPIVISGETIQQACIGANHVCAVTASKKLYCWGRNASGQTTGTPDGNDIPGPAVPLALDPAAPYLQVGCGGQHTCALLDGGSEVHCWGDNSYGQLGDGTDQPALGLHRVVLPGVSAITKLVVGYQHACVLHDGDRVSCWGNSALGQVGSGLDSWFTKPTSFVQKAP